MKLAGVPSHRGKLDFLKTKVGGWAVGGRVFLVDPPLLLLNAPPTICSWVEPGGALPCLLLYDASECAKL